MREKLIIVLLVVLGIAFWMVSLWGGFGAGGEQQAERDRQRFLEDADTLPNWVGSLRFLDTMPRLTVDDLPALRTPQVPPGHCRREGNHVVVPQAQRECFIDIPPADADHRKGVLALAAGPPVRVVYEDRMNGDSDEEQVLRTDEEVSFVVGQEGGTLTLRRPPGPARSATRIELKE